MAKQAKCKKCKVRWIWFKEIRLTKPPARCPDCGEVLVSTSQSLKWPVKVGEPKK